MIKTTAITILITGLSGVVFAKDTRIVGDIEYGQHLAAECVTCHSALGKDKGIPPITGWNTDAFKSVINAYKSKELENPAMRLVAGRLDEEQIASLALYFASQPESE
jgi:cytochrome c